MANIVLQLSNTTQQQVERTYAPYLIERKAPGVVFAAKLQDTAITSYKSGKVMFQGAGAEREAAKWQQLATAPVKAVTKGDTLPEKFAELSVIGSDETGTGDYFGPITVAAAYVPAEKIALVRELGVKDSKQLTDDYIRQIAPDLMHALHYSLLILRNEKYNDLQQKGYSQGRMKGLLHNQALQKLLTKIAPEKPDYILIDQFAERGVYYNYLKGSKAIVEENVLFSTKAENLHVAVATASIIARYAFLLEMDKLSDKVGFTLPKGAGAKVDDIAARILRKSGEQQLQLLTKWHFANTEKAKKIAYKR